VNSVKAVLMQRSGEYFVIDPELQGLNALAKSAGQRSHPTPFLALPAGRFLPAAGRGKLTPSFEARSLRSSRQHAA
jgi:hypothetical protein